MSAARTTLPQGARIELTDADLGRPDSLRYIVLTLVAREQYERASEVLRDYIDSKPDYPQFKARAQRYLEYAGDLINGIKAKRGFPGLQNLPGAKQKDLFERAMDHFNDLKATLKKVEAVEAEVRLEDLRSTVWVIQAIVWCSFAIAITLFMKELAKGVFPSMDIVLTDATNRFTEWFFDLIGW